MAIAPRVQLEEEQEGLAALPTRGGKAWFSFGVWLVFRTETWVGLRWVKASPWAGTLEVAGRVALGAGPGPPGEEHLLGDRKTTASSNSWGSGPDQDELWGAPGGPQVLSGR